MVPLDRAHAGEGRRCAREDACQMLMLAVVVFAARCRYISHICIARKKKNSVENNGRGKKELGVTSPNRGALSYRLLLSPICSGQ